MRAILFISFIFIFSNPVLAAQDIYICPMHPHISGEQGDNCPICGMSLVPKVADTPDITGMNHDGEVPENALHITPTYVQALGVRSEKVKYQEFGKTIRSFGELSASTRREHVVSVREKGWVSNLKTNAIGDVVKKGDVLFTYYSPDVMSAQSDYLIALRRGSVTYNAEQRLRLVGMDDKAIALFKKRKKMMEETPFHAPIDGVVSVLNVRSGSHIREGGAVLSIQDFSKIWVNAKVPLRDLQFLKVNSEAQVAISETGKKYKSTIDYIHPVNNAKTRTVDIRLILDNEDGGLKTNSYVDVVFQGEVRSRLSVPSEAVIYDSRGAHVIENVGDGYFRAVMIEAGVISEGVTEIISGISEGQNIVTSGQFMIDAESNLRGAVINMEGSSHVH